MGRSQPDGPDRGGEVPEPDHGEPAGRSLPLRGGQVLERTRWRRSVCSGRGLAWMREPRVMSHFSVLFRRRRVERGLTTAQLARLLGYRNVTRGCNRIRKFEAGGKVAPDLLSKLAEALGVTPAEIQGAIGE